MFWNRLRKTNKLIEHIVIFHLDSTNGDPVVEYVYPSVNNENSHFHRLRNFVLPCKHKSLISEEYTLIFTDSDGTVEFFACITLPISGYIVCISSYFPYFELLHSIITLINQEHLYREENRRNIEVILKELHYHSGVATLNISLPPNSTRHWLIKRCNASHSAILRHIRSTENVASTAALLLARPYLELMAILLGRYRSALHHNEASSSVDLLPIQSPNDESRSQDKFDQPRIGGWFFDRATFVVSCGHELQPYLTELLNSQMVIQFFESRVAVLNSDMAFIPPDDFEDIIDHVSIPRRSGGLNDLLNFGRTEFDKITRKSNSATSKAHSRKVLIPSLSTRPSEQDICEILRKKLEFKKDNNLSLPTHYQQNNDTNNLPSCDNSIWQPLSPKIDHELRNSERTNRSLLTSILSELPDLTADFYPSTTSRVNDSQVSLRNRSQNIEHKPFNLRCNSSKRMGCYVESPEKAFHNWVTFDSSPPTCSSEDLINLTGSPFQSSNTLDPFSDDSFSKSLSTNTKPAKCDHNELEQAILDEFDQLSISRMRKT
ncbi:uncharacterized protein DC041_0012648 [Schistosoma bovis]|uniref:UDENN domain-containing protein n=1 Tax=Schistosoma bovis TaxID=6184 RepID=A0A430Q258_SCHBO|nr:uncharacterized protein DC041_0012648 [Schistosoma bovis]